MCAPKYKIPLHINKIVGGTSYMTNNTTDFIAKLKVILDKTSLKNIQKELSKQNLAMKVKIDVDEKASFNSLKSVMKDLSSQLPTSGLMDRFICSLRKSVTELKEIDTYLNKIGGSKITLPKIESTKTETTNSSSPNSILDKINSFNKLISTSNLLAAGLKDIGSPKTPGLMLVSICR